jgi:2-polyprenyl-3-methyl-5-hydroxy-6-metoxy-1,4-benzoquinol methylase
LLDTNQNQTMESGNHYIIKGGEEGKKRLNALANVLESQTRSLINSVGDMAGRKFLDVGCGGGNVSMMAAELVGKEGHVTAVDFDQEIIHLAIKDAQDTGIENITYRALDAYALDYKNQFDVAYSRFLLSHLQQPQLVLNKMAKSVKTGGRVIVEDIDFSGPFCHPSCDAFSDYVNYFSTASGNNGQDPNMGLRLLELFRQEPLLDNMVFDVIQPCHSEGAGKWMAYNTMDKIKETVVKQGLADLAAIEKVLAELKTFTEDTSTIISLPRIFRVMGYRST